MTKITVKNCEIIAKGHANAERINDYDLVCCAISTLLCTLGNALLDMYDRQLIVTPPAIEMKSGYVHIKAEQNEAVNQIFKAFIIGLESLEKQYPKNIVIAKSES